MSFIDTRLKLYAVYHLKPSFIMFFFSLTSENQVPPEHMRSLAAQLNDSKAAFLHNLRRHLLKEASFSQEEDIDVERVVKRAVDGFEHEKTEILLRVINENK